MERAEKGDFKRPVKGGSLALTLEPIASGS